MALLDGKRASQLLAGRTAGAAILCVEVAPELVLKRQQIGYLDHIAPNLDAALAMIERARVAKPPISVVHVANSSDVYPELVRRGATPDVVTDQTTAHDRVHGLARASRLRPVL